MNKVMGRSKKLGAEVMVIVGSGQSVEATDIESLLLYLESGFILSLDDVLVLTKENKNIIFIPVMDQNGYQR